MSERLPEVTSVGHIRINDDAVERDLTIKLDDSQKQLAAARSDLFAAKKLLSEGIAVYDKTFSQRHEWRCRVVKAFPVLTTKP